MQFCNLTGRGTEVVAGVMAFGPLVVSGVFDSNVGDTLGAPDVGVPGSFVDCGCWWTWGSESWIRNLRGPPPGASLDPFLGAFLATFCSLG